MTVFASSNFPGSNGTELSASDPNWSKVDTFTANALINGTGGVYDQYGNFNIYKYAAVPPSADYYAEITAPQNAGYSPGVVVRTTGSSGYLGYYHSGIPSWVIVYFTSNSSSTYIANPNVTTNNPSASSRTVRLAVSGNVLTLTSDGVSVATATHTGLAEAGYPGINPAYNLPLSQFRAGYTGPTIQTLSDQAALIGGTATFSVSATGTGTLHYQWKSNGSNVGTDSSSYTTGTLAAEDTSINFTVAVTDDEGTNTSSTAHVTFPPPTVTLQPLDVNIGLGSSATFTAGASPGSITYQWQDNKTGTFTNVVDGSGATSATYTSAESTAAYQGRQFRCALTNANGTSYSVGARSGILGFPIHLWDTSVQNGSDVWLRSPLATGTAGILGSILSVIDLIKDIHTASISISATDTAPVADSTGAVSASVANFGVVSASIGIIHGSISAVTAASNILGGINTSINEVVGGLVSLVPISTSAASIFSIPYTSGTGNVLVSATNTSSVYNSTGYSISTTSIQSSLTSTVVPISGTSSSSVRLVGTITNTIETTSGTSNTSVTVSANTTSLLDSLASNAASAARVSISISTPLANIFGSQTAAVRVLSTISSELAGIYGGLQAAGGSFTIAGIGSTLESIAGTSLATISTSANISALVKPFTDTISTIVPISAQNISTLSIPYTQLAVSVNVSGNASSSIEIANQQLLAIVRILGYTTNILSNVVDSSNTAISISGSLVATLSSGVTGQSTVVVGVAPILAGISSLLKEVSGSSSGTVKLNSGVFGILPAVLSNGTVTVSITGDILSTLPKVQGTIIAGLYKVLESTSTLYITEKNITYVITASAGGIVITAK